MPSPSSALGRPDLAMLLEDFDLKMNRSGFVGLKLFPRFDTDLVSANASRIKLAQLLQQHNTARNADGTFGQMNWQFEQWNYNCVENALEGTVDRQKAKMFRRYLDAEMVTTELVHDAICMNQERRVAAAVFNTTTYGTVQTFTAGEPDAVPGANTLIAGKYKNGASANVKWTTYASCTPIFDVLLAQLQVYANSGLWPDTLVISKTLFKHLKQCAQIIDRIKYTKDPDTMSTADLAAAFDLKQILVAGGSKNTADNGQTSAIIASIWDSTQAMVCKVAEKVDSPWDPGIGRTFYFSGNVDENAVETYYSPEKDGDVVRVRHTTDEKSMYSQAGCLITAAA